MRLQMPLATAHTVTAVAAPTAGQETGVNVEGRVEVARGIFRGSRSASAKRTFNPAPATTTAATVAAAAIGDKKSGADVDSIRRSTSISSSTRASASGSGYDSSDVEMEVCASVYLSSSLFSLSRST